MAKPTNEVLGAYYHEFECTRVPTINWIGSPHLLALSGDCNGVRIGEIANPENTVVIAVNVGRISDRGNFLAVSNLVYYDANSNPPSYYCFHGTHESLTICDKAMLDRELEDDPSWIDEELEGE